MHLSPCTCCLAQELALHDKVDDAWCAINGRVYDITPYLGYHPGGEKQLMRGAGVRSPFYPNTQLHEAAAPANPAGKDATELFRSIHSWVNVEAILAPCWLGMLAYGGEAPTGTETPVSSFSDRSPPQNPGATLHPSHPTQRADAPALHTISRSPAEGARVPTLLAPPSLPSRSPPRGPPAPPRWHSVLLLWRKRVGRTAHLLRFELPPGVCLGAGGSLGSGILLQASYSRGRSGWGKARIGAGYVVTLGPVREGPPIPCPRVHRHPASPQTPSSLALLRILGPSLGLTHPRPTLPPLQLQPPPLLQPRQLCWTPPRPPSCSCPHPTPGLAASLMSSSKRPPNFISVRMRGKARMTRQLPGATSSSCLPAVPHLSQAPFPSS